MPDPPADQEDVTSFCPAPIPLQKTPYRVKRVEFVVLYNITDKLVELGAFHNYQVGGSLDEETERSIQFPGYRDECF